MLKQLIISIFVIMTSFFAPAQAQALSIDTTCTGQVSTINFASRCESNTSTSMYSGAEFTCVGQKTREMRMVGNKSGTCQELSALYQEAVANCQKMCDRGLVSPTPTPSVAPSVAPSKAPGCTKELSTCPDGTKVGRTGPNCEFVCPKETARPTTTPKPGCYFEKLKCAKDPCYPIEVCPTASSSPTPTPTPQVCSQEAGSCIGNGDACVSYKDGCEKSAKCIAPYTSCSTTTPAPSSIAIPQGCKVVREGTCVLGLVGKCKEIVVCPTPVPSATQTPNVTPTTSTPPTADPTAQKVSCSVLTYKLSSSQGKPDTKQRAVDPSTLELKKGDRLAYSITFTNPNSYEILPTAGNKLSITSVNLNGVNEPIDVVGYGPNCKLNAATKSISCLVSPFGLKPKETKTPEGVYMIATVTSNATKTIPTTSTMFSGTVGNQSFTCTPAPMIKLSFDVETKPNNRFCDARCYVGNIFNANARKTCISKCRVY